MTMNEVKPTHRKVRDEWGTRQVTQKISVIFGLILSLPGHRQGLRTSRTVIVQFVRRILGSILARVKRDIKRAVRPGLE